MLLTFPKTSWKLRYRRHDNKTCVKHHLIRPMLTFKLLLFVRLILTLGSGVGFPHWSHNWTIRDLCNSLPLITATGWKRCKCMILLFNSTHLGHLWATPFPYYLSPRTARPRLNGMQECISSVCLYSLFRIKCTTWIKWHRLLMLMWLEGRTRFWRALSMSLL